MDNCLVDFNTGISKLNDREIQEYNGRYDEHPYIFSYMEPMKDAIIAFNKLSEVYDCYILSTAPWGNPNAWLQKREWVEKYLGNSAYKRLILSHHKNLNVGDYLIDDRTKNGAGEFTGELIQFGKGDFTSWKIVMDYLLNKVKYYTK
jgi:5'(3')-deoxyribonucleotidase